MPRKPEQMSPHKRYLKIETHLSYLADEARDASNTASILTDGPEVPYLMWHDAAEELPKAIRKLEKRLKEIKRLWNGPKEAEDDAEDN